MTERRYKLGDEVTHEFFKCEVIKIHPDLLHYDLRKETVLGYYDYINVHVSRVWPKGSFISIEDKKEDSVAVGLSYQERPMKLETKPTVSTLQKQTSDTVVLEVIEDLTNRSLVGIEKYNTTLDRTDIDLKGWLSHAYEEALDHALYLKRAMREF